MKTIVQRPIFSILARNPLRTPLTPPLSRADAYGKIGIEMKIKAPIDKVFDFFSEPRNFEQLLPAEANFDCVELTDGSINAGAKRHINVDVGRKRMEQVMETVVFDKNHKQVDQQIEGDMKMFEKIHLFEVTENSTKFRGIIDNEMPYSVLGKILDRLMVKKEITSYFQSAYEKGKEIVEHGQYIFDKCTSAINHHEVKNDFKANIY